MEIADLQMQDKHHTTSPLGACFYSVNNDLDPHFKVTSQNVEFERFV